MAPGVAGVLVAAEFKHGRIWCAASLHWQQAGHSIRHCTGRTRIAVDQPRQAGRAAEAAVSTRLTGSEPRTDSQAGEWNHSWARFGIAQGLHIRGGGTRYSTVTTLRFDGVGCLKIGAHT